MTDINSEIRLLGDQAAAFNPKNFTFFVKPTYYDISEMKMESLRKYAEIIQWGRSNPIKFCERFFGVEFLDFQKYVFMMSWTTPYCVWCMSRNGGKALDLNTRIPTPLGDKTMRDIHVGDLVFNENGMPTKVTYESPIYFNHQCYEIEFEDGERIIADAEHNWYVHNKYNSKNQIKTSKEIVEDFNSTYVNFDNKKIVSINMVETRPVKCIQVASNSHLYLCGNKDTVTHNTTLGSPFLMAKSLLLPKFEGYILSSNGSQSIGMMKKIESIAKKEIASFTGLTDVFMNEMVKSANSEGIRHDPASWSYKLYSGSSFSTINGNYDGARGRRSRLNFYDEAAYIPEDMYAATLPFVTQNSDFALGGDIDVTLMPPNFTNQIIMASSAGSQDDVFYKRYKEYAMHSLAGDKRYFCADVDCEIILTATYNGKIYPVPLLTREKIESEMKMNPTKATREYKNKFDTDLGEGQIIKKSQVIKNSYVRVPELCNVDNLSKYSLSYDPARKKDNSVVTVGKYIYDENKGWMMEIVNCINMVEIHKKSKKRSPIETPKQIKKLKGLILDYNGQQIGDYSNIHHVLIDAGTGGQGGTGITDALFEDWYEEGHEGDQSFIHRGLIDPEYSSDYVKKYPNAAPVLKVLEPSKIKVVAFTALIEMIEQGLITFSADYDYHGYLNLIDEDGNSKQYNLSFDEEEALVQIDALKEEIVHMYRYKSSNAKDRFDLAPGCENLLNDDRAYTIALLAWDLFELRRENIVNKKKPKTDTKSLVDSLTFRKAKINSSF